MPASTSHVHDLTSLLGVLQNKVDEDAAHGEAESLTLNQVLELIGRRAYGPLLLVVGLISISPAALLPGSTWIFATVTLLIALQLAFHRTTPWLPKAALRMKISEKKLGQFTRRARPVARVLDKVIRPRLTFLADPPWSISVAILCVLAALITYPLSLVPLAPMAPGLAIALFGLGMTARDGVLLIGGTVLTASAVALLIMRAL